MGCLVYSELSLSEWGQRLLKRTGGRRHPWGGTLEITERCNLACVQCYINQPAGSPSVVARELTTGQFLAILDQIADAGCVSLLLTGGEIMLRPDFSEIYRHAKRAGLLVSLFTNGTLLTPRIAEMLAEWPPQAIEITVYGHTPATYEAVTQVPGSHARCLQGIDLAVSRGLPLRLKTVLLSTNRHELAAMRAFAAGLGVEFRYDAVLWPRLDGEDRVCAYRLSPQEVVALDAEDPERQEAWRELVECLGGSRMRDERVYSCAAGLYGFHVDASGQMSMCMMARRPAYDLLSGSFRDGWAFLGSVRDRKRTRAHACPTCELGILCDQCPAWSQVVHRDDETPAAFNCELASLRAAQLGVSTLQIIDTA